MKNTFTILRRLLILVAVLFGVGRLAAQDTLTATGPGLAADTIPETPSPVSLPYPVKDYPTVLGAPRSGIDLRTPSNVQREIMYDPETQRYYITEKIGNISYRMPQYLDFSEYGQRELERIKREYWLQRTGSSSIVQSRGMIPKLEVRGETFDRLFGGNFVDIRPQGLAEVTFGGQFNNNANPLFNERQRKQGSFNFDQNIQMNLVGNIGEKLRVTTNYNSQAQFDFENQIKFEYTGYEDEIIRKIEVGQVNLPISGSLITGYQSLFGVKTQLQFGRLGVTTVFSQQKSQTKEIVLNNGAQVNEFKIKADEYEANKHYFLAQFFRDNYNRSLANLPFINSGVVINKIEVWVTNKTNNFTNARDIIAFLDLGENDPYNDALFTGGSSYTRFPSAFTSPAFPRHSNNLLEVIPASSRNSNDNSIAGFFAATGASDNYVKLTYARQLASTEFTLHPSLGYISLNQPLNADEVLAVAFRYTVNGVEYQVGEFSTDIPNDPNNPSVLYTKLLKNETLKTNLPTWDLMMKNIYSLQAFQIEQQDFRLDVYRLDESTGIEQPVIAEGSQTAGKPFLQLVGLDRINGQQAPQPDGVFDFLRDITVDPLNGRIIFPVVEPFGEDLARQFAPGETALIEKYVFRELYDSTRYVAQQAAEVNKYFFKGTYRSGSGSEFSLNAINVPQGSVVVTAGTTPLIEGVDYTVDYNLGRVRILNEAILNSGMPVSIKLESNELFGLQSKTLFGTRLDYQVNDKLVLGGTFMNLKERPLTPKVNIGEEAISNTIWGFDASYRSDSRWLTKLVDKLPLLETRQLSTITFDTEFAHLMPGHSRSLNVAGNRGGVSYIDDFETSRSVIDLKNATNWYISSTPSMFPESALSNDLSYGFNRALLAFYNIDPIFYNKNSSLNPDNIRNNKDVLSNHYVREVLEREVFPNKESISSQPNVISTLNLAFYPNTRGPYNFTTTGLNPDGTFSNPASKWGGIMRRIETSDFESLNVEFVEFWMMDPFINKSTATGGDLYINLGNVSEDILKDGRKSLENALPVDGSSDDVDQTVWGKIGRTQPVTDAFDNNPDARRRQDVGLDGLNSQEEREFYQGFLQQLQAVLPPGSPGLEAAMNDPSSDDFAYYRGSAQDAKNADILERYRLYNGMEGNSKTAQQSMEDFGVENSAATPLPDAEDINRDNNSSQTESYYQYKVSIRPEDMEVGRNYITDKVTSQVKLANGRTEEVTWYQFKIPLRQYTSLVGGMEDFKTIRFIRMFLTDFQDTTVLRMARLQLLRGEWRRYNAENSLSRQLKDPDLPDNAIDNSVLDVSTINIEENGNRQPIPYVLPPGIEQERVATSFRENVRQNEQSLVLDVKNLADGFAQAAFKNIEFDFRSYKHLQMFIHAEGEELMNGDVTAFIRLGTDYQDNYYEYEIPMQVTPPGTTDRALIWPAANELDVRFEQLIDAKLAREDAGWPVNEPFFVRDGTNLITVEGQPDLSKIRVIMIGVRNPLRKASNPGDDGLPKTAQIWVNELRLSGFDEEGGWAASARLNAQLADFANITLSGSKSTFGFGSLERQVGQLNRYDQSQFDMASSFELGKFFPDSLGVKIPMYVSWSQDVRRPEYNPFSPDILLKDALDRLSGSRRDSLKRVTDDVITRKSINFTNVRKLRLNPEEKPRFYDLENFSLTYAFSEFKQEGFTLANTLNRTYKAALAYNFQGTPRNIRPFGNLFKGKALGFLGAFNFTPLPSIVDFRIDVDRYYSENTIRAAEPDSYFNAPTTYFKNFQITRLYGLRWDLASSLQLDYTASNLSIVDEPDGPITDATRDVIMSNLKKLGRNTDFSQSLNLTYAVPVSKLPYLDWVNLNTRYSVQYNWQSEPLATLLNDTISLGNTIRNERQIQLNPQINFDRLYSKFGVRPRSTRTGAGRSDSLSGGGAGPFFLGLVTSLKNISGSYSIAQGTFLPGYLPGTQLFGLDLDKSAPGLGFILGGQKDIRYKAARNGWLTRDDNLNSLYYKTRREDLNLRALIEPFPDFRIELTGIRSFTSNTQSNFRFDESNNTFREFSPVTTGNFNISTIALKTAFKKERGVTNYSELFEQFKSNRMTVSRRLGARNPYSSGVDSAGYARGYGATSQEVLVNAFLAAYLGKDPGSMSLDQFPNIPLPNWNITYNGLSRLPFFSELFSSVIINHGYQSTYSIANYNSLLQFRKDVNGHSMERDIQENFYPEFQVNFVNITENFVPLIGADMRFRNNMTANLEYRKGRSLSFSMANSQLAQQREQTVVGGLGYRTTRLRLPFPLFGQDQLNNDLLFKLDVALRSDKLLIYRLGEEDAQVAGGTNTFSVRPSIDYMVNQRFNLRLFFDHNVTRPETSNSYRTAYSNFGINLRFNIGG